MPILEKINYLGDDVISVKNGKTSDSELYICDIYAKKNNRG